MAPIRRGLIFHAELNYSGLHLTAKSVFRSLGPGFISTLSYIPRVDIRQGVPQHGMEVAAFPPRAEVARPHAGCHGRLEPYRRSCRTGSSRPASRLELTGNTTITSKEPKLSKLSVREFPQTLKRFRRVDRDLKAGGVEAAYERAPESITTPPRERCPFSAATGTSRCTSPSGHRKRTKIDETYLFSHLSTLGNVADRRRLRRRGGFQ